MDIYHTTDFDGISELNPDSRKMRKLLERLDEIDIQDEEHPDVSLVHDASGWSISVFPTGIVTFENLDHDDLAPLYMNDVSRHDALRMWLELSRGEIGRIKSRPWLRAEV